MRRFVTMFLLTAAAVATTSCLSPEQEAGMEPGLPVAVNEDDYYSGLVRVKLTESKAAQIESAIARSVSPAELLGMESVSKVVRTFPYAGKFEARTRAEGMHLWYDVYFKEGEPLTKSYNEIEGVSGIQKVELRPKVVKLDGDVIGVLNAADKTMSGDDLPFDDTFLSKQWHYINDGSLPLSVKGADINVRKVWEEITTGSDDVIVSVVDGGIDVTHPDLKDNLWVNEAEMNGEEGVDDDGNGYVDDIYGYNFFSDKGEILPHDHGTHVAGTIAAVNNNGMGVCGIAGGDYARGIKGVKVMSCQIVEVKAAGNIAAAIKYGADNGAVISQNSWGFGTTYTEMPESEKIAIDYFIKYAGVDENGVQTGPMKGGLVIFAAGNDNARISYPAQYDEVLAVSSLNGAFKKPVYSNYGDWVDMAAPGGDASVNQLVASTITVEAGEYGYMQGTSMACPHISGVAALLVSHFGKEDGLTPYMVRSLLINSGYDISSYNEGNFYKNELGVMVDAYGAFVLDSDMAPETVKDLSVTSNSNNIIGEWTVPSDPDEGAPIAFGIYYSKSPIDDDIVQGAQSGGIGYSSVDTKSNLAGAVITGTVSGLEFNTEYYVRVDAYDMFGNRSALSEQVKVTTGENHKPEISKNTVNISVKSHEKYSEKISYSDPDWHKLTWKLSSETEALSVAEEEDGTLTLNVDALLDEPGKYVSSIIFDDGFGMTSEVSVSLEIQPNTKPEAVSAMENIQLNRSSDPAEIDLDSIFEDKDGEELSYEARTEKEGVVTVQVKSGRLVVTPVEYGLTAIYVTASDARGESVEGSFKVLVANAMTNEILTYPNPVNDYLFISVSKDTPANIRLTSPLGRVISDNEGKLSPYEPTKIDMRDCESGTYSLVITTDREVITRKIVKL